MPSNFPQTFLRFNEQQTKNLVIVVEIPGVDLLSNRAVYTKIRYGDRGLKYGENLPDGTQPVYGGLRKLDGVRDILSLDGSSLTISQRLEPEQGRASISQISMSFIDKDKYMSQVISPGVIIPEIMGAPVRVWMGYAECSYPEEFIVIFRGRITDVKPVAGLIALQFSDPNFQRRQQIFTVAKTKTVEDIAPTDTFIPVADNANFLQHVLGPDGLYDVPAPWNQNGTYNPIATRTTGIRTFIKIKDEFIEYGPLGFVSIPLAYIESLKYVATRPSLTGITVQYTPGAVAGSEVVTVTGGEIIVQIQDGVSTAHQVMNAIQASTAASALVTVSLRSGFTLTDPQVIQTGYNLALGFDGVVRGARGTVAGTYASADDVSYAVQIQDHAIDMALKMMLSGWAGPWKTDVPVLSVQRTFDGVLGDQPRALILPNNVDAVRDYGLSVGDYITIKNSTPNNGTCRIVRFGDLFEQPNRMIYVDKDLVTEFPTSMLLDFRSQFDTYPVDAGVALTPEDVDVDTHLTIKGNYLSDPENSYRFFITQRETCKSFIETEIYLPVACYSLTKRGKLSIGFTKPPIADDTLQFLDKDSVLDPDKIQVQRGLNTRKFFNELIWQYDQDDNGNFVSTYQIFDADSFDLIGVLSTLPIKSRGARTDLGTNTLFQKRSSFILSRYRKGAILINMKTNWKTGCQIEAGDIVALKDEGDLQITNMGTGDRNLGTQLFEVVDRTLDYKTAMASLQLVSGIQADVTDRYATFSPSSIVASGDQTQLVIQDSFGAKYPGDEMKKWRDYVNQPIVIHDDSYTFYLQTFIAGFDPVNNYRMFITGWKDTSGNPATPPVYAGSTIDIPYFPDDQSKTEMSLYKSIHAFRSPTVAIAGTGTPNQFDVSPLDVSKFFKGAVLRIHTEDWSVDSGDVKVQSISGNTIILESDLEFTPDVSHLVSGIGFPDRSGFYRYI
jgi:hypothetical protein